MCLFLQKKKKKIINLFTQHATPVTSYSSAFIKYDNRFHVKYVKMEELKFSSYTIEVIHALVKSENLWF